MLELPNGGRLVQDVTEMPRPAGRIKRLYADFETTSGDDKLDSLNPWHHCWVAGIAVTWDDVPGAWYVPCGHRWGVNLPLEAVQDWWCELLDQSDLWVNHNVKYDMHVSTNALGVLPELPVKCTLTQSKIIDSDRMRRGLDELSKDWLHEDISQYGEKMQPYLGKCKDYGNVPPDIMAEYACQDVMTNRRLDKLIDSRMPEQCHFVRDMEVELTSVLFDMERVGMPIDVHELKCKELELMFQMQILEEDMNKIVGRPFRAHVNEDCFEVLCGQYGLPVLAWTQDDEGNKRGPSFDKDALNQYLIHPFAPYDLVWRMIEYRAMNTLVTYFVRPYQKTHVDGLMHAFYNQMVRTGRLACKQPNAQQLSPEAKELVHPLDGEVLLSLDQSQIEFRTIVHYINDQSAIKAFNEDPDTDFHMWVAEMIGIKRKPAKTVNFLIAFGGGKERLLGNLSSNMDLVGHLKKEVEELVASGQVQRGNERAVFDMLARKKAEKVYDDYHGALPGIKRTSRQAAMTARTRGYVFNMAGRRRHLPKDRSHIAFNTLNQGSAADLQKERTVAVHKMCKGTPIKIMASVHDDTVFRMPKEVFEDPRTLRDLVGCLESPHFPLRVPVRVAVGVSDKNWKLASKGPPEPKPLIYDKSECGQLEHLK